MPFNTISVGAAVTPSVIETYFSHFLNRAPLKNKPTAHISYHEGLRLIRDFLDYSSKHTVEDIQAFTGQKVVAPPWVRINDVDISSQFLKRAAKLLHNQLGPRGIEQVGGATWWQWRRPEAPMRAEWIEMKKDYSRRKASGQKCERSILYIHGGAYYFGSVDEHRYQMQRHARKLHARVFAPRYRLSPQFPFPCGLQDCLAAYLYLLEHFEPNQILFAGDSAGGGMVLSMLVTLRDQGQPLPAGTILLSPWVDLTHSFPSVAGSGTGDYIPANGFHHRPSMAWPPAPSDEVAQKDRAINDRRANSAVKLSATSDSDYNDRPEIGSATENGKLDALTFESKEKPTFSSIPAFGGPLFITLDNKKIHLREQIQMYTTNTLLNHPLVSPVLQPSLGGLPPMLIQTGGAELLHDEQVYLAHKAANPAAYAPNDTVMREFDPQRKAIERWPPTNVQLQVWDDLCHVPHTLSFTRPAKYMYRGVAQFGAWALANAQHQSVESKAQDDDAASIISSGDETAEDKKTPKPATSVSANGSQSLTVGSAGDPLPAFKDHMIRQRVTRHGVLYPLPPAAEIPALSLDPIEIGVPKSGPVRKWLATHELNEQRFANEKKKTAKKKAKELSSGYGKIPGENPPPAAVVNRRDKSGNAPSEKKRGRSRGLALWSGWGSSHDESTLQREEEFSSRRPSETASTTNVVTNVQKEERQDSVAPPVSDAEKLSRRSSVTPRLPWSRSRDGETAKILPRTSQGTQLPEGRSVVRRTSLQDSLRASSRGVSPGKSSTSTSITQQPDLVPTTSAVAPESRKIPGSENTFLSPTSSRPHNGVQAYPFKLRERGSNPSIITLGSELDVPPLTPFSESADAARQPVDASAQEVPVSQTNGIASHIQRGTRPAAKAVPTPTAHETQPAQTLPFKLRNRVYDSRTPSPGAQDMSSVPAQAPSSVPFKLRHGLYEPGITLGRPQQSHDNLPEQPMWIPSDAYRDSGLSTAGLHSSPAKPRMSKAEDVPPAPPMKDEKHVISR